MRINFLSIIACFLFVCVAVSSCLDSENTYEVSSDATVHAFGLDTIHGKHYKFAVDQLNRKIYNLEPLPVGADTLVDSILIDTFQVAGYITSGLTTDTILNISHHQDLRAAINLIGPDYTTDKNSLKFKVHAPDLTTTREYSLSLRVYQHHPDSMRWESMATNGLPASSWANRQEAITLHNQQVANKLLFYALNENGQVALYQNSAINYSTWEEQALTGIALTELPQFVKLQSIQAPTADVQETLYTMVNGQVYQSKDGAQWTAIEALNAPEGWTLKQLICGFSGSLIASAEQAGQTYLLQSNEKLTTWQVEKATILPEGFPTQDIYATEYQTANLLEQLLLVGRVDKEATQIIPWAFDGRNWTALNPDTEYASYCLTEKVGHEPAVMHYNGTFYLFGETLNYIYTSKTRLAWYEADKKFFLPKEIALRGNFTSFIDREQYIWILTGATDKPEQNKNEIWRGRLNKFGYDY